VNFRRPLIRVAGTVLGVGIGYSVLAFSAVVVMVDRAVRLDRSMEEQELADELFHLREMFGTEPDVMHMDRL